MANTPDKQSEPPNFTEEPSSEPMPPKTDAPFDLSLRTHAGHLLTHAGVLVSKTGPKSLGEVEPGVLSIVRFMADAKCTEMRLKTPDLIIYATDATQDEKDQSGNPSLYQEERHIADQLDNIFEELTRIDHGISQDQSAIAVLNNETRELLAELRESIL